MCIHVCASSTICIIIIICCKSPASFVELFYFSFIADVRTPAIKLFYFTFIFTFILALLQLFGALYRLYAVGRSLSLM